MRKIIFEILKQSKIAERLDVSDEFWTQFGTHNRKVEKQVELYETENKDNVNICTIAVSPKENFEKFKDRPVNKKQNGVEQGMDFESYGGKITPLREVDDDKKVKKDTQKRLQVHNTEMKTTSVSKVKFASLKDRRCYFSYGIVSLSYYGHRLLPKVRETKRFFPKIHHVIEREKNNLLKLGNEVVARNERLRILG